MSRPEIVILAARRTAFGTMSGALEAISATDLAVHAAKAAVAPAAPIPFTRGRRAAAIAQRRIREVAA